MATLLGHPKNFVCTVNKAFSRFSLNMEISVKVVSENPVATKSQQNLDFAAIGSDID